MKTLMNKSDMLTSICSILGFTVSIENLDNILNLILLIISIINILTVLGLRLYSAIKSKNVEDVKKACEEAKEDLNDITRNNK